MQERELKSTEKGLPVNREITCVLISRKGVVKLDAGIDMFGGVGEGS